MGSATDIDPVYILKDVGKSSWLSSVVTYAAALPIWAGSLAGLALSYLANPKSYSKVTNRSDLQPPASYSTWNHAMVHANGISIHVVSPRRQSAKPLMLFVHGFPECWYSWRHQMDEFKEEYDVVAIDMRGYGESDKPEGVSSYQMDTLVSDIQAVVHGLGHRACTLVAHDWGGALAWMVAARYPELVQRLVVMAGPHMGLFSVNRDWDQFLRSWYILMFQAPLLPEQLLLSHDAAAIAACFTPGGPAGPTTPGCVTAEDVELFKKAFQQPRAATSAINYYRALMFPRRPHSPQLQAAMKRRLTLPVLVLWGKRDRALGPQLLRGVEQVAPLAEVHMLDCSHWIQQDVPGQVNQLVRAFLQKHPPVLSRLG